MACGRGFDFDGDYGARYDRVIRLVVPGYDGLYPLALGMLRTVADADARVLVVGAGTGSELVTFGTREPNWSLTSVEPSRQMQRQAEQRVLDSGLAERVRFHHGHTADLPGTPLFDAATLIFVMHFLPDDGSKATLLDDIAARLRPGAPLVLVDLHGQPRSKTFTQRMDAWMKYIVTKGVTEAEREQYKEQLAASIHYVTEERIRELLDEAGFANPTSFYGAYLFGGWLAKRKGD